MSKFLNARLDITGSIQVDFDQWNITGMITDNSGTFTEMDIAVGDVIYNDQTWLGIGVGRYVITNVDPSTTFGSLACTVQWDIPEDPASEPAMGFMTIIGQADPNGTTAVTNTTVNQVDESFLANVRNIESMRMSKKVTITTNLATSISTSKEPKLGAPLKDGSFLVSNKAGQRSWKSIDPIDRTEKGINGGVATLDLTGKIPMQQLPADVQTDVFSPTNEIEMLALPAQKGDFAIRDDVKKTYILSNLPASVLDNWKELASSGGSGGSTGTATNAGTANVANEAKKIQPFRIGATYSIGEMVVYDGLIWMANKGLFSVPAFVKDDWQLVAGNMDSYQYDSDGDGIIDRANHADDAQYAMKADVARMIQYWAPGRQYVIGEQLVYGTEFYVVKSNFTAGATFDATNLDPMSLKKHSVLLDIQGGNSSLGEYYHLTSAQASMVSKFGDNNGKLVYNSKTVGDMQIASYDTNNDGIVNQADKLTGVTVQPTDINQLQGIASNVQGQINTLKQGIIMKGSVPTYADLVAVVSPVLADAYIVMADETHLDGLGKPQQSLYIWNGVWTYLGTFTIQVRDFGINPLNIVTESVGIVPEPRVDNLIARKSELHNHPNKYLLDSYSFTNADFYTLQGANHSHSNYDLLETYTLPNASIADAVTKAHSHNNQTIIDSFSKNVDGKLLFEGKLIEGATGGGSGTGITDLSGFTTNDLADYVDKRYITDLQRDSIAQLPSIKTSLATTDQKVNDVISKIPGSASVVNKLATLADLAGKVGVTTFKQLTDVNPNFVANAFVTVNASGTGLTYLNKIDMKIQKITDMDGNIFTNVPMLNFKDLDANIGADGQTLEFVIPKLKALHTTDLLDMPKTFVGTNGQVLIANESKMTYELQQLSTLTNSKANYSLEVAPADWSFNNSTGKYEKIVAHALGSTDLIVAFYDDTASMTSIPYRILDPNQILLSSDVSRYAKVVVNCSQGVVGNGTGGTGGGGGYIAVTADTFIDDTRLRLDKTFSSQHINDVLAAYAKKTNIYTRAESDSLFATISSQHVHANIDTLNKLSVDGFGNPMFNNKPLLTSITSATYQQHWADQTNASLSTLVDIFTIYNSQGFGTILNNEFTIKNVIPSVDAVTDAKPENLLRLVVVDGTITIMDVLLKPQETQKYILGISPNIKVLVQGKLDANLYIGAF